MPTDISRVYLIGLMGAGKSTIGKILANNLQWQLIDIDDEIEAFVGSDIMTIFEQQGEDSFRDYETQILLRTTNINKAIIPCGGGVVIREENIDFLTNQTAVWLDLSPAEAASRLGHSNSRPLLNECQDTLAKLNEIFIERRDNYSRAATIHVQSGHREPVIIADEILKELELKDA